MGLLLMGRSNHPGFICSSDRSFKGHGKPLKHLKTIEKDSSLVNTPRSLDFPLVNIPQSLDFLVVNNEGVPTHW
jgi:hypothetical protein